MSSEMGPYQLCNSRGPGTDWIADDALQFVPTFAVALLKGTVGLETRSKVPFIVQSRLPPMHHRVYW